ncbi:MAG: hypothetical protein ACUVQN_05285, partial [Caldisericia bacterium]
MSLPRLPVPPLRLYYIINFTLLKVSVKCINIKIEMKFYDFSRISEHISKIKKRNMIIDILLDLFSKLDPRELIVFIELSLG